MDTTKETWKFINTFAPWFSAIGTLAAVIVSLYLARKSKEVKIKASVGHRIIIEQGSTGPHPEYVVIKVVNHGGRITNVTNIGWKVGFYKKRYGIQTVPLDPYSSKIPVKLNDGEEATFLIPLKQDKNWISSFSKDFLLPSPRYNLFTVRLQIFTSVGKTFSFKIEEGLKNMLLDECKKQIKS